MKTIICISVSFVEEESGCVNTRNYHSKEELEKFLAGGLNALECNQLEVCHVSATLDSGEIIWF